MVKMEGVSGGRVAQLGEHLLCKQGVRGSNPLTSTNLIPALSIIYATFSAAPLWCIFGTIGTTMPSFEREERTRSPLAPLHRGATATPREGASTVQTWSAAYVPSRNCVSDT